MRSAFAGFPKEGIAFLRELKKNNDREWFQPRKEIFEENVRQPMIELVTAVHKKMMRFAPEYVGEPAKVIYRIYRDTRFSKDKTPYKTHIAANMKRNGMAKDGGAGFYFAISPENVAVGGGIYMTDPNMLLTVRHHIAEHHAEFRKTFEKKKVRDLMGELYGESMTRVPRGFDVEHPAAELLKRKRWFLYAEFDPKVATTPKVLDEVVSRIEAIAPFVEFLNRPLTGRDKKLKVDERFLR